MFAVFRKYSMKFGQLWKKRRNPAVLIKTGDRIARYEIHTLINSILIKKNCLIAGRSQLVYLFIRKMIKYFVVTIQAYYCNQEHMKFSRRLLCRLPLFVEVSIGYHYCGFGLNRSITYYLIRCPQILVKMGIQSSSTSDIYGLKGSLRFIEEAGFVYNSPWVRYVRASS